MKKIIIILLLTCLNILVFAQKGSIQEDEIFVKADQEASFPGGIQGFYQFLVDNLKYPRQAQRMGVQGRVYVQFIVKKDGSITDINLVKGIGAGCDEEALRVVKLMPKWIPANQKGEAVRFKLIQQINFVLTDSNEPLLSSYARDTLGYYAEADHFSRPNDLGVFQFDTSGYSFTIEIDTSSYIARPEQSFTNFFNNYWKSIINDHSYHYSDSEINLTFEVLESGELTNFSLGNTIQENDTAIVRALMNQTNWKPGHFRGIPKSQKISLIIYSYVTQVYDTVDISAIEPKNYINFLKENFQHPRAALVGNIECSVEVEFIVEKSGKLSNLRIVKGNGYGCEEEVLRLFRMMPKWTPALNNEMIVKQKLRRKFPINEN